MFFLEHLCDMATREGHPDYVRMIQRDILRIVDAAAPEDGSGAANVKVVRKVCYYPFEMTHVSILNETGVTRSPIQKSPSPPNCE